MSSKRGSVVPATELPAALLSLVYATATNRSKWQAFCDELYAVAPGPDGSAFQYRFAARALMTEGWIKPASQAPERISEYVTTITNSECEIVGLR